MSFAGDTGLDPRREDVYESEGSFHLSNNSGDLRLFWKNAFNNIVKEFWKDNYINHYPSVMGLQEINKTKVGSTTGSGFIESQLKLINPEIQMITEEVDSGKSKPALSCIWNRKKIGELVKSKIDRLNYIPDLEVEYAEKKTPEQGRPILIVYTTFGYLLVVLHAPNDDGLARHQLLDFKRDLKKKINDFLTDLQMEIKEDRIFIMGDFNDKYDSIRTLNLTIKNKQYNLSYNGLAPLSCCHNWNSSCTQSRFSPLTNLIGREGRKDIGNCNVPKDSNGKEYTLAGRGKRYPMGDEGNINNYKYYGDKVFGSYPKGNIKLFRNFLYYNKTGYYSQESDHEMVISTFLTKL
jgi:hypothetical protein